MPKKLKTKYLYLIPIILIAIIIRFFYYHHAPGVIVQADTYGYYEIGQRILSSWDNFFTFIINEERTPMYPLFLNITAFFSGGFASSIFSPSFLKAMTWVMFIQSILGVLSLIILYKTLLEIKIKPIFASLFTLFISLNIIVFGWERILMTEALTTFWLITTTFLAVKILKLQYHPKLRSSCGVLRSYFYFLLLFLLFLFGFLLRPFYLFFPPTVLIIICLHHRNKQTLIKSLLILLSFYLLVFFYIRHNTIHFKYSGVNQISEINLLGKILTLNLPIEAGKEIDLFYQKVKEYREINGEPMPFRFIERSIPDIHSEPYLFNDLRKFNYKVIFSNFPEYLAKSTRELPHGLLDVSEVIVLRNPSDNFLSLLFNVLFYICKRLQYLTLIILPAFPITLLLFITKVIQHHSKRSSSCEEVERSHRLPTLTLFGAISFYQIFFSVFFSYGEFGRLISPAWPIIYLFSFLCWGKIIKLAFNSHN